MKVIVLTECNSAIPNLRKRVIVSYYIETENHKILFDLGPNSEYATNGSKLSVDISKVDSLVLSSGFSDTGGGLKNFTTLNSSASIYVHQNAFDPHYTSKLGMKRFCGLDESLKEDKKLVFTNNLYFAEDDVQLLSNVPSSHLIDHDSTKLYIKYQGSYIPDTFKDEQYLLVEDKGKRALFLGNPFRNMVGIIKKAESIANGKIDYIFTGFHFLDEALRNEENAELVNETMKEFKDNNWRFYTSKLNSKSTISILEQNIKDQVTYFSRENVISL